MSQIYKGEIPEARIVSFEQDQKGVARMVLTMPMVFEKSSGGLKIPMPANYPNFEGYGFAGARGREGDGGAWNWEISYEGAGPLDGGGGNSNREDQTVYAFEPSDAEVPITGHPDVLKWVPPLGKYGRLDPDTMRVVFNEKLPEDATAADVVGQGKKNPFFGVEAYLSFGGTWTKSYLARNSLPNDLFDNVECIVTQVPQPAWMKLPPIGRDRNWLKRMPSFRVRGKSVEITERYMLSGRGGHNRLIYTGRNG